MNSVIVNSLGLFLISFITWWFWLSKPRTKPTQIQDKIEIKVKNGVYQPAYIKAEANKPIILRFIREDASPCAEMVLFNTLNISKHLALDKPTDIFLKVSHSGEYEFTCQMGMYRGKLIID